MRRGIRGKSKVPASDGVPRGLRGKEIGLYYKNKNKEKKPFLRRLEVPESVVAALQDNIKSIERIAVREGIYLEPVKELRFVKPNTDGADFIPLQASDYEKESHHITNIIPKDNDVIFVLKDKTSVKDDDVVYVATGQSEPETISDDSIEVNSSDYDSKILLGDDIDMKPTAKKARPNSALVQNIDTDRKPSEYDIKHKIENDMVSRTVPDSDSIVVSNFDACMKMKAKVEPSHLSTKYNDLLDDNDDVKPSSSDMNVTKIKKGTDLSTDANSDVLTYKEMKVNIKEVASCSSTKLNDVIVLDDNDEDVKPSISDMKVNKIEKGADADSKVLKNMEIKANIKLEASFSSTNFNDVIILDDNDEDVKPSISDMKVNKIEKGTAADSDVLTYNETKADIKQEASCSSTKSHDVILLDDYVNLIKSDFIRSKTNSLPKEDTDEKEYKYGYEDIVTGKFEDKLDESLAKGIEINIKNDATRELSETLLDEYNKMIEQPNYIEMRNFRQILPTYKMTEELLDVVNNNQVIVISGETGCGKSTQVPQIILDDAIKNKRGGNVKILVTEPRRIAASSLAMRVAEERAESTGKSVGYSVRLERVESRPRGSIMFCTTGVLLVELEVNQSLSNFTHVILDEVHERDCQIDISMCMLRQVLKKRKDLKLILMSATIDSESLSAYFDNCPMLHITGLAYPVKDVYLEEILHMTHYQLPPVNTMPYGKPNRPWLKHLRGRRGGPSDMEKEIQYRAEIGPWLESIRKMIDRDVYVTLQDRRIEELDINLLLQLLLCVSRSDPGAILVFLPGIGDITKLIRLMTESQMFPSSLFEIHPLHSKLPTLTQHKIFRRPPGNIRKIIVATNIAETSITIDDIVYVVDCAKVKHKGLNVQDHVSTLQTEWASQANLRQRRGRAGRCQPGICYHLVTSYRASKLEERPLPELQRDDLLETVLQIKRLRLGLAAQALSMMPAVPHETTISNAIRHLQQCGALDQRETLTPLGWHMARLPVHPAAGKLLLLGALFGCLERAASVAAIWGFKDPFQLVIGKEREVDEAKKNLALGEPSDHVAMSEALIQWENIDSYSEKNAFAREYYLSMSTLKLLSSMKTQFGQNLKQMGFLRSGNVKSIWENRNTDNLALFKAIVAAALYPNIGTVRWMNPTRNKPNKYPYIKVYTTDGTLVQIHPSSVMTSKEDRNPRYKQMPLCANPGANWLVYWLKQRSTNLFLIDVTLVYTLPLLFFGELNVTQGDTREECLIDINTVKVCCNKKTTLLLFRLRSLLDQVLASKIKASGEGRRSSVFEEHVLNAVISLITAEDARTEHMDDDYHFDEDVNSGISWF